MANEYKRPLPVKQPESDFYWEKAQAHELWLRKCNSCEQAYFYPRDICPHCFSRDVIWVQASGKGKLYSFEIAYRTFNPAFTVETPFILAMVELEEGPRMMSNLINIKPDPAVVKCDMPVEVVFEKQTDEVTLALFQPAG